MVTKMEGDADDETIIFLIAKPEDRSECWRKRRHAKEQRWKQDVNA